MKGSRKPSIYQFRDPIYKSLVRWCVTDNLEFASKFLKLKKKHLEGAHGYAVSFGTFNYGVWFRKAPVSANLFNHEIHHIGEFWASDVFGKNPLEINEPQAYYVGWLAEKMEKALKMSCNVSQAPSR